METTRINYSGDLRTEAVHVRSNQQLITDAPTDNQGKGEAFSPTDLMATSLGSCMLTIMGIAARKNGLNIDGTKVRLTKVMASNPRRVQEVIVEFDMPDRHYSSEDRELLNRAAVNCPVAKSLHPDLIQTVVFNYNP